MSRAYGGRIESKTWPSRLKVTSLFIHTLLLRYMPCDHGGTKLVHAVDLTFVLSTVTMVMSSVGTLLLMQANNYATFLVL